MTCSTLFCLPYFWSSSTNVFFLSSWDILSTWAGRCNTPCHLQTAQHNIAGLHLQLFSWTGCQHMMVAIIIGSTSQNLIDHLALVWHMPWVVRLLINLACQRPLWQYFIKASLPLYSALARAKKTSCTANTSGAISTDICRRGRGQDMYIYYTHVYTHILLYIYILFRSFYYTYAIRQNVQNVKTRVHQKSEITNNCTSKIAVSFKFVSVSGTSVSQC